MPHLSENEGLCAIDMLETGMPQNSYGFAFRGSSEHHTVNGDIVNKLATSETVHVLGDHV